MLDADVERIAFIHAQEQNLQKILRVEVNKRSNPPHAIETAKDCLVLCAKPNRVRHSQSLGIGLTAILDRGRGGTAQNDSTRLLSKCAS